MSIPFAGEVKHNELIIFDKDGYYKYLCFMNGMRVNVDISEFRERHSKRQRGYLWGVVYRTAVKALAKARVGYVIQTTRKTTEFGLDADNLHHYYKTIQKKRTTKDMNTKEYAEFTDYVRMDLADPDNVWDLIIQTPEPNEDLINEIKEKKDA